MLLNLPKYLTSAIVLWSLSLASPKMLLAESITPNIHYHIQGLSGSLHRLVETRLKEIKLTPPESLQDRLAKSKQAIQSALEAYGYFRANIQQQLKSTAEGHAVTYTISPGPPLLMTVLSIQLLGEGNANGALKESVQKLRLREGMPMTTENYQAIKQALYKSIVSEGYLETSWKTHTVAIDLKAYTATVTLAINTGPHYTVGHIQLSRTPFSSSFIKRYLKFQEGDPYRLSQILQSQILLRNSGYFQDVFIETPTQPENSQVPLRISITPAAKYYTLLSLGYRSDLGLRAKAEGLVRRLNNRGHQIAGMVHASKCKLHGLAQYTIPGQSPATQQHYIQLEYNSDYKEPYTKISPRNIIHYLLSDRQIDHSTTILRYLFTQQYPTWKLTPMLSLHYERFKPTSTQQERPYLGLIPGMLISKAKTDWFKERHHYTLNFQVQGTTKPFSSIRLLKLECEGAYFGYLGEWLPSSYLILRGRVGSLFTSSPEDIPASLRFHAGGYRYPRGHKEYELGPHMWSGGLEIRTHLAGLFYFNPFFEWNHDINNKTTTTKGSTGIGLCLWYPHIGHVEISGVMRINPDPSQKVYGLIAKISTDL
jgi:outer membrane translocation and assembly module TamA